MTILDYPASYSKNTSSMSESTISDQKRSVHVPVHVVVLVLGDIGRSPRMQYHALALANSVATVDLIGYTGSSLPHAIQSHARIHCHFVWSWALPGRYSLPRLVFLAVTGLRVLGQWVHLLWLLLWVLNRPDYILVQTPPAIPTLFAASLAARLRSAKLVIDWHNFGYSLLALTVGQHHLSVRFAHWYERTVGRWADAHLCVSQLMGEKLIQQWGYQPVTVLYDQPAEHFTLTPPEIRQSLFQRLQADGTLPAGTYNPEAADRPALIVSSTSWTLDEDFDLLLNAVAGWDARLCQRQDSHSSCVAVVLITGKGPLREHFEAKIKHSGLQRIQAYTLWLSAEDYPRLLGAADLGVCLHRSSSGFDLPMKVVDMFGAGLPVCALDYGPCLAEQLQHEKNGLLFTTSRQLADQLDTLFRDFPHHTPVLDRLRQTVLASNQYRWTDAWNEHARPIFTLQ